MRTRGGASRVWRAPFVFPTIFCYMYHIHTCDGCRSAIVLDQEESNGSNDCSRGSGKRKMRVDPTGRTA